MRERKPTLEGKAEKDGVANKSEMKNPKGSGENQERQLFKEPNENIFKNKEVTYNLQCHREINEINPERYAHNFSVKKPLMTFLKEF